MGQWHDIEVQGWKATLEDEIAALSIEQFKILERTFSEEQLFTDYVTWLQSWQTE